MSLALTDSTIVVLEPQPYWGPELKRQFEGSPVSVRECRFVRDLNPLIDEVHPDFLVIDLEVGVKEWITWQNSRVKCFSAQFPILAVGSDSTMELEWLLREAGVTDFIPHFISSHDFARLCRRQLGLTQRTPASPT